jgi:hypothetical protein
VPEPRARSHAPDLPVERFVADFIDEPVEVAYGLVAADPDELAAKLVVDDFGNG